MRSDNELLTLPEALALLHISRTKMFELMKAGAIQPANRNPLLARPRRLLFSRKDLERLARDGSSSPQ